MIETTAPIVGLFVMLLYSIGRGQYIEVTILLAAMSIVCAICGVIRAIEGLDCKFDEREG